MINYPNGKAYHPTPKPARRPARQTHSNVIFGNRGMRLEEQINAANAYYRTHHQAVIHKKPIPIQIVNVDYPKRSAAVIKEAYFKQASTTDYNGVYAGFYVDFEAKETNNKTAFPLKNFHAHQVNHLKLCHEAGGICFTLVGFAAHQEVYLMPAQILFDYWHKQTTGRKSIPYSEIKAHGWLISTNRYGILDYLPAVRDLITQLGLSFK